MKYIIIILLTLILTSCSTNVASDNIKVITFDTSIHCENCANKMFNNLPKEEGVIDLEVGIEEKTVTIIFNEKETTPEKLAEIINKLGYSAYLKSLNSKN